jgi:uncharacterized Zn finger protein
MPHIYGIDEIEPLKCPHCGNERTDMIEKIGIITYLCNVCSKIFKKE